MVFIEPKEYNRLILISNHVPKLGYRALVQKCTLSYTAQNYTSMMNIKKFGLQTENECNC